MLPPLLVLVSAAVVLGVSVEGMLSGVEPFATWFYVLAWYPTLAATDAVIRLRTGRWWLFGRPAFTVSVLAWSLPFWLFFELVNFRIANWFYVFVPDEPIARRTGIVLSFATVLPAILVFRRLLETVPLFESVRWPRLRVPRTLPGVLTAVGVSFFLLALSWPRVFFPLIWGGVTLLVDPWVYRRAPERSLLGTLERGRPAVVLQLLLAGLMIGFLWELWNSQARGKWIYTVPGLEELKLFEMPVLGFLGFPVLALDGWAIWNALVVAGLAAEPEPRAAARRLRPAVLGLVSLPVLAACSAVLLGIERLTIASTTPDFASVVGDAAPAVARAGYDVFTLAEADPAELVAIVGVEEPVARAWVERARLATLRGMGVERATRLHAAGIRTIEELAAAEPAAVVAKLQDGAAGASPARVRVWIRGAGGLR